MTDSSGATVWQGEYLPFGEPYSVTGSITNNLRFPGQYFDAETGLHQNWNRNYKSNIGRYLEVDPALFPINSKLLNLGCIKTNLSWLVPSFIDDPGSLYPYIYSKSDPVNLIDPTGLACGPGNWGDAIIPDQPYGYNFDPACSSHDGCYGTCGKSKRECDKGFYRRMRSECNQRGWYNPLRYHCNVIARIYYRAVQFGGIVSYKKAQKKAGCCP
jgi:RHS repeat-associated protein